MNCTKCESELRITHTYTAGAQARTQRAVCVSCGLVHIISSEVVEVNPGRGKGAAALARKLKNKRPSI